MKHAQYLFALLLPLFLNGQVGETMSIQIDGNDLVTYQAFPMSNPLGGEKFKGSNFIHPLKTPSGFTLTNSQPYAVIAA